ncbi:sulfotransferase family protein [Thiohalorhabdus denitrificans]|uniref:Sulfotransferase domain-containing protein n=1 Tax=Thiohalorhabdus denitrificans TaxID=381306 RepID=A0A1G5AMV4_9GAMM|nr:sulfotransferase [Thiohalorhabdus denitrificans]SCX79202.1 Sulfotransferase domain-containing protein [Thiohalorhabdus denitrificans]
MIKLPDFFIVGAPKCGTTSLYSYLSEHPQIFMSPHKEPTYFGKDLKPESPYFVRDWESYKKLFKGAEGFLRVGEASVYYMFSHSAAKEIYDFNPDSKIVIIIRNPVDMMYSLHGQLLLTGNEDVSSFESAINLEDRRRKGWDIPKEGEFFKVLFYREVAKMSEQIYRYYELFGREQVYVMVLEEFKESPETEFSSLLRFLEVDPGFSPDFYVKNKNKSVRIPAVQNFLRSPPPVFRKIVHKVFSSHFREKYLFPLRKRLKRFNLKEGGRGPISPQFRKRLDAEFAGEVEKLEKMLDRPIPLLRRGI